MSNKIDTLLKKAVFFEKLAMNGDRISLLRALADEQSEAAYKQMYNLDEFGNPIRNSIPPVPQEQLDGQQSFNPYDKETHNPLSGEYCGNDPSKVTTSVKSPSVDPKVLQVQKAINMHGNISMPLAEDGKLGPDTAAAIKSFRGSYKVPSSVSDSQLYQYIIDSSESLQ